MMRVQDALEKCDITGLRVARHVYVSLEDKIASPWVAALDVSCTRVP
jgi:hypothetical protein